MLTVDPHPRLDLRGFAITFPQSLGKSLRKMQDTSHPLFSPASEARRTSASESPKRPRVSRGEEH